MADETWYRAILRRLLLRPDVPLTLALDPDDLLLEDDVQALLAQEDVPVPTLTSLLPALDDREVQAYLDTMFLDGRLRPVRLAEPTSVYGWVQAGVYFDPVAYDTGRFQQLLRWLESGRPGPESSYRDWLDFASRWAEAVRLRFRPGLPLETEDVRRFEVLHNEVEVRFADWLQAHYAGLATLSPVPVIGHRVAEMLAYRLRQGEERLALIVVDGLAWDLIILTLWRARLTR